MKLLITGGGTGGHVYPGVAVARELLKRGDEHEVLFVGAKRGVETTIVPREGFSFAGIDITALKGKGIFYKTASLVKLVKGIYASMKIIKRFAPDATLGVGGYASGAVGIATVFKRVPLAIAEQNLTPGMTNRWLSKFAKHVFVTWEDSCKNFPSGKSIVTGNPVRPEFFTVSRKRNDEKLSILVTGGSQGASSINKAVTTAIPHLNEIADNIHITHQTGANKADETRKIYAGAKFSFEVEEFFEDMPQRIADADLVISRSGAGAVAEICAVGRAAIYIPFPFASDDHQTKNGDAVAKGNGAIVMKDSSVTGKRIADAIKEFANDRNVAEKMGKNAKKMAREKAAEEIVDRLLEMPQAEVM